jgi:hypothetical protein
VQVKRQVIQQFVVEPVVGVIVHSIGQTIIKAVTVMEAQLVVWSNSFFLYAPSALPLQLIQAINSWTWEGQCASMHVSNSTMLVENKNKSFIFC